MALSWEKFTPTEKRIVELLRDCKPHPKRELFDLLSDDLADRTGNLIAAHISNLRAKLKVCGYDVVPYFPNGSHVNYRIVKLADPMEL